MKFSDIEHLLDDDDAPRSRVIFSSGRYWADDPDLGRNGPFDNVNDAWDWIIHCDLGGETLEEKRQRARDFYGSRLH